MEKKMNVLAVGAHPDDVELGCGGTLAKHVERGDKVFVIVLTNGDQGNHVSDMSECKNSLQLLGVKGEDIYFGNFPDGFLQDNTTVVSFVESIIKKHSIDRVYTHDRDDRHQDHRRCSLVVSAAARKVSEIFLFEGPSTNVIDPHYYISLSKKHLDRKIECLNCYKTQVEKGIVNVRAIELLANLRGIKNHTSYAEAFALNHICRGENDI